LSDQDKKSIPLYSIDRFQNKSDHSKPFKIELFDKNRDFKVTYPHRHDFYEILLLTEGSGIHTIDFQEYHVKPNSVFFLSPGQIHSLQLSQDIKGYIFVFTSEFYLLNKQDKNKLLELPFFYNIANSYRPLYLEVTDANSLVDFFKKAVEENDKNMEDSPDLIRSFLDIILISCSRLYPESTNEKSKKSSLLVKRFKQLIEEKFHQNLSVKDYAELLSVTPNHLSETVKTLTGRTSTDLINDKMILEVKRMLMHTDLTVSEVAYQLNFSDQSYFSRYFKKNTGQTPIEFRNNLSKGA
jgi:AraC family transcriptional activator of pobA